MMTFIIFLFLSFTIMAISLFLSKKSFLDKEKVSPFECGFDPHIITRTPFSLRFFKISIIFLIFDIEIVLILPSPIIAQSFYPMFLLAMMAIIIIIMAGLLYEWNQGSLDWVK